MKFFCVYSTNKYKLKDIKFKNIIPESAYFFNTEEIAKRIAKPDYTQEELDNRALSAYIYKKLQSILTNDSYESIFYRIKNLEISVILNLKELVQEINPEYDLIFCIPDSDTYILDDLPKDLLGMFSDTYVIKKGRIQRHGKKEKSRAKVI